MKRQILCLSGWGQKFDSLEFIFNDQRFDPFCVSSLDYSSFDKVDDFFDFVKADLGSKKQDAEVIQNSLDANSQPEILVGWSLGGQLAVRLVAQKILKPKLLILIAPPFQFIKDARVQAAMAPAAFKKFRDDFAEAPDKTLKQFAILTAMNDRNASDIARELDINDKNFVQLVFWLDELARFSCFDLDLSDMPPTLYFHGSGDIIVPTLQAQYFKERIKNFKEKTFAQCGHAPQLSYVEAMRSIIAEEVL